MLGGPSIVLKLLGRPQLLVDGMPVADLPKKVFVLATMLILNAENMGATRDEVSAFLWPDAEGRQRGASFRTLIRRVRAVFGGLALPPLRIDDHAITFVTEACRCDLVELRLRFSCGDPEAMRAAAALMDDALLEGCDAASPSHRAWIEARRESLALEFALKATQALKSRALLGNARLRETLEQKILEARPIDAEAQLALAKLIGGRPGAKSRKSASPSPVRVGRVELPLERKP